MKKLPVLIINSYAGSLTIAAHRQGHKVIGSYEDGGYGLPIQRANFPKLDYRETTAAWPVQDLWDALVIAHPPCAAFSQQNITKAARGLDAPKFQETKHVISYALKSNVAGLAVESVCGALEGARAVHDELGAQYGYDVFRVLQNACSFGVPQWRERFWVVYLPRGRGLRLPPVPGAYVPLQSARQERGTTPAFDEVRFTEQRRRLEKTFGKAWVKRLFNGDLGLGAITGMLQKELAARGTPAPAATTRTDGVLEAGSLRATAFAHCLSEHQCFSTTSFLCRVLRLVDPAWVSTAVIRDNWWVWPGATPRTFFEEEYKACMGFPTDYVFPDGTWRKELRTYLSRGVVPAVAEWVLQGLQASVEGRARVPVACQAGQTLDLRPARAEVREKLRLASAA